MNVARGRAVRRVHISVRVQPQISHAFRLRAKKIRYSRAGTHGDGVVPAEDQRKVAFRKRALGNFREALARFRNFVQVLGALFAVVLLLGLPHADIAYIFDRMAQRP